MRIQRYLLAECLVLALAVAGAALAVRSGLQLAIGGHRRATVSLPASVSVAGEADPPVPNPAVVGESAGSFLGLEDDPLMARLRSQPIVRMKLNRGGSSLSFRIDFADGSRAAFKPAQTNLQTMPRKEVAAYRINRLLGLGAVPPATPRMVSRADMFSHLHPETQPLVPRIRAETIFDPRGYTAGVVMYWVPVIKDPGLDTPEGIHESTRWLTQGQSIPANKHALAAQLADLLVFDLLISNPDRYSGGNLLTNEDGSRLLFMDNTLSFMIEPEGNEKARAAFLRSQRFSRRLYEALDRISEDSLTPVLAHASEGDYEILTKPEIRAVLARRDFIRRHIDGLSGAFGEGQVLYFP